MNIIKNLQQRIADRLTETKNACKTYATEDKAEQVAVEMAQKLGNQFDTNGRPCRYVVFKIESLDRWTAAFDYSELFGRNTAMGGYIGTAADAGFYTF